MHSALIHQNAPDWFTRALAQPGQSHFTEVLGCRIHYAQWGDPKRPGLLFVPASGGHTHWFDHVAPLFADQFNVVAIDLSGCGDSDRRPEYAQDFITAEIMGVLAASGMLDADVPATLVGHSAGAQFALRAAIPNEEALLGVISVDGLRYARLEKDHAIRILTEGRPPARPPRVYVDYEDAVARFRLAPAPLVPIDAPHIIEHIARHSFQPVEGGWTSKFDTAQGMTIDLAFELLGALKDYRCHTAAIVAEHSHLADETASDIIGAASQGKTTVFVMPGTTHYPPIDSPLAFVAAIKGIVLSWIAARSR
ncbi:MAG TPA: alpha/beta hydrolase [Novosphingobium sp.]